MFSSYLCGLGFLFGLPTLKVPSLGTTLDISNQRTKAIIISCSESTILYHDYCQH